MSDTPKQFGLSKSERLAAQSRIDRLFQGGRVVVSPPLRCHYRLESGEEGVPPISILVSVPKKYHKRAWRRNLLKRRIREAYRLNKCELSEAVAAAGKHVDIAFVYTTKEVFDYQSIENGVKKSLAKVQKHL
ncbi:MAG: ribonuclease P protein component [Tidjanibacter sp.]|nr:ribonuclease P protein component [Tidjanibacter sp.]MBR6813100.1 ribonuclease P protein component [Tidjanibacter sp.]MBR7102274.1 ribonuclease P protein component [Tidjanibacter sp.]